MNLFTARAAYKRLKYYDEHVHCDLDGAKSYNWRHILEQVSNSEKLSLPQSLRFSCKKVKFERLNQYDWLKTDFVLPLISKNFSKVLETHLEQEFEFYPVVISSGENKENHDYCAFYLKEYFECLDMNKSIPTVLAENKLQYDYWSCKIADDLNYPIIFKIKGTSTPYMHFMTDAGKKMIDEYSLKNIALKKVGN